MHCIIDYFGTEHGIIIYFYIDNSVIVGESLEDLSKQAIIKILESMVYLFIYYLFTIIFYLLIMTSVPIPSSE